jgi:pilus assembly protein CpaF
MAGHEEIYKKALYHLLSPIREHLEDPAVSEVMINGFDEIYVERAGKLELTPDRFPDVHALEAAMRNVAQYVGKRLTPENLSIEARLPDGSRVHIVQAPAAPRGLSATIRKFSKKSMDLEGLVARDSLTTEAADFLGLCVAMARNVIVSGGTGSGKTTLLNCLSGRIPEGERIIVIEDSSELQLQQEHVVPFEVQAPDRHGRGGIDIRELFRASLRMRPDRIVVGECRGGEALDMIQAMTSGHAGSLSTCHANTPRDAMNRLETMALMSGVEIPLHALRAQVASAVDLVVQISRLRDGSRRVECISEILGLDEQGSYDTCDLFRFEYAESAEDGRIRGALARTGQRPSFAEQPYLKGMADRIGESGEMWTAPGSR